MRRISYALPVLAAVLLASSARTDEKTSELLKADNWEGLMDFWKIDGNTVVGASPKEGLKSNTFLCSKKKYKDFEMSFKVRLKGGGDANSGVQIRSQLVDPKTFTVAGPQCDMGGPYWGSLYGERFGKDGKVGGGHMMKAADTKKVAAILKKDDFNDYQIKCVGKHVTIAINHETIVDGDFDIMPEEGIIAFQLHVTREPMEVTFKDIEFKEVK